MIKRVIIRIFLFLIVMEILLRLSGVFYLWRQDWANRQHSSVAGKSYTIVCMGDSMTSEGEEASYPAQLEKMLREKGWNVEVINKGMPAQNSATILPHVKKWLDEYKPQMVITMVGANDWREKQVAKHSHLQGLKAILARANVYNLLVKQLELMDAKLKNMMVDFAGWFEKKAAEEQPAKTYDPRIIVVYEIAQKLNEQGKYREAEPLLRKLLDFDVEDENRIILHAALGKSLLGQRKTGDLRASFRYILDANPYHDSIVPWGNELCAQKELAKEVLADLKRANDRKGGVAHLDNLISKCYATQGNSKEAERYAKRSQSYEPKQAYPQYVENYNAIVDLIRACGAKVVLVQYPLMDVDVLKGLFKERQDYSEFIFVDNALDFREALKPEKYAEYFEDHAVKGMGHCTPKGNRLLAENIFEAIANEL